MKAKLLTLSLFLFSHFLHAQSLNSTSVKTPGFLLKLEKDDDGLFTVIAKSTVDLPELIVGSVQISIVAPEGGIEVTDIVAYGGDWDHFILNKNSLNLENDYLFFGLRGPFDLTGIKAGDEIKLLSFRNAKECIGPISLLQPDDPIAIYTDINSGQDMSVIDGQTFDTYHFLTTYGVDQIDCKDANSNNDMLIEVDQISARAANITWIDSENAVNYQLEVRAKGAANWDTAQKLTTQKMKAYFYGPVNQEFEGRVIATYEDGTTVDSAIFKVSTLPKTE